MAVSFPVTSLIGMASRGSGGMGGGGEGLTFCIQVANDGPLGLCCSSMVSTVGPLPPSFDHVASLSQTAGLDPFLLFPVVLPSSPMLCQCDRNTRPPRSAYALRRFIASCDLVSTCCAPSHDRIPM